MGNAAVVSDDGLDTGNMLQRLEALQREREELDAQLATLGREDDRLVACLAERVEERERIDRRLIEIEGENAEIEARRDALEDEQAALVHARDALDQQYTDLYALLDRVADTIAAPNLVPVATTDRIGVVAPWRTTLVIVPKPGAETPAVVPPVSAPAKPWKAWVGVLAIAAGILGAVTMGAIAAWPDDPAPAPSVDPKEALEMVRAALVPDEAKSPSTPPIVAGTPASVEPAAAGATPRATEKRRARTKRSRTDAKTKKKSARP